MKKGFYRCVSDIWGTDYNVLFYNIYVNMAYCGMLVVVHPIDRSFQKRDYLIVRHLAAVIESYYGNYIETLPYVSKSLRNIVQNLVEGLEIDEETLISYAGQLDMKVDDHYVCITLRLRQLLREALCLKHPIRLCG